MEAQMIYKNKKLVYYLVGALGFLMTHEQTMKNQEEEDNNDRKKYYHLSPQIMKIK